MCAWQAAVAHPKRRLQTWWVFGPFLRVRALEGRLRAILGTFGF